MFNYLKIILAVSVTVTLVACGGGGGGGATTAPAPVASTATFQLLTAQANDTQQTSTLPFTISGTFNGFTVTGNGSVTRGNVTSGTFESQTVLQRVMTSSGNVTANGVTTPISTVSTSYFDSNYIPLGSSGTEYVVVQGTATIPATALVNDSGNAYTATRYTSSAKSTTLGTETVTFALLPDTANTALLRVISVYRDNSSAISYTVTTLTRITPSGAATRISETETYPNGNNLVLTY